MKTSALLSTAVVSTFLAVGSAVTAEEAPVLSGRELSDFLGPVSPNLIRWTKASMIDFQVYNGEALPPLSGNVGFYVGSAPSPEHPTNSSIIRGRLGRYSVKWYRWNENGQEKQQALVYMRWFQQVDIWINAPQQSDIDRLVEIVSQLPLFNEKPKSPIPGIDNRADELLDVHPSLFWGVILSVPVLFLIGIWLLSRHLRRLAVKASRRAVWLTAYSFGFFLVVGLTLWFSAPEPFSSTVIMSHAMWLTLIYGATLALLFFLILPILALIARCRGR